jgi:hypothetical protein
MSRTIFGCAENDEAVMAMKRRSGSGSFISLDVDEDFEDRRMGTGEWTGCPK